MQLYDFLNVIDEETTLAIHIDKPIYDTVIGCKVIRNIKPRHIPFCLALKAVKSIEVGADVDFDLVVR